MATCRLPAVARHLLSSLSRQVRSIDTSTIRQTGATVDGSFRSGHRATRQVRTSLISRICGRRLKPFHSCGIGQKSPTTLKRLSSYSPSRLQASVVTLKSDRSICSRHVVSEVFARLQKRVAKIPSEFTGFVAAVRYRIIKSFLLTDIVTFSGVC